MSVDLGIPGRSAVLYMIRYIAKQNDWQERIRQPDVPSCPSAYFPIRLTNVRSKNATRPLDHIFHALSDPTRRSILTSVARGDVSVSELARRSNLALPTISKHLKTLEKAQLIRRRVDPRDGRAFVFEARLPALDQATSWLEQHRSYWNDRFDELEQLVSAPSRPTERR
jgi:DNA-binding transcriptional ArsR family regulator